MVFRSMLRMMVYQITSTTLSILFVLAHRFHHIFYPNFISSLI